MTWPMPSSLVPRNLISWNVSLRCFEFAVIGRPETLRIEPRLPPGPFGGTIAPHLNGGLFAVYVATPPGVVAYIASLPATKVWAAWLVVRSGATLCVCGRSYSHLIALTELG